MIFSSQLVFHQCPGAAMSFKIVFTVAVAFLCGVKTQDVDVDCDFPNNHPENCDTTSYLSHLTCRSDGCTCIKGDPEETPCDEITVDYDSLSAEECNSLCTENAECRFYKYTSVIILSY